jgi:adenine deaminase
MTALKAMTIWPAWQHFEEASKGSIEKGKLADFVILTEDPTAVKPNTIHQIKVAETIKEGVAVYTASPEKLKKAEAEGQNGLSKLFAALALERDFRNMPENRQTPLVRKLLSGTPHNPGCVSGVLADLTEAMLSGNRI